MDISRLQFGQLSAKLNIRQKFEDLDVNSDNKINAEDVLSATDTEILNSLNEILNYTDTDAELADDADFDMEEIDNALKSGASAAASQSKASSANKDTAQTSQNQTPTLVKGKYVLNGKPYTGLIDGVYYEKGKKAKGTKLYNNILYVKDEKAKGEVLYKKILYIDGEKAQGYHIYKKTLYLNGEKSKETTVYNDTLFINGKQASGKKLYNGILYEKGKKSTKTVLYNKKLYVMGKISKGEVDYKNKRYKDGELLNGASTLDGKYYKKGKLADIKNFDTLYKSSSGAGLETSKLSIKKGVLYENNKLFNGIYKELYYKDGILANGTIDGKLYINGKLANDTIDGKYYIEGICQSSLSDFEKTNGDDGKISSVTAKFGDTTITLSREELLSYLSGSTQYYTYSVETADITDRLLQDILMVKYAENQAKQAGKNGSNAYNDVYNKVIKYQMIKTPENMENIAGEIVEKDDGLYVNNGTELVKLNISADTYLKLFQPIKRYDVNQGEIGDCYFVSSCLTDMMKNPTAFSKLIQMFSEDENGDINISFAGSMQEYSPVKFKSGELYNYDKLVGGQDIGIYVHDTYYGNDRTSVSNVTGATGLVMLEQAYSISKFASETNRDISSIDIDETVASIWGGWMNNVYNEVLGLDNTWDAYNSSNTNYEELFDSLADDVNNYKKLVTIDFINLSNEQYGIVHDHAYSIEKIDKENKTVYITNPWFSGGTIAVPYSEIMKYEKIIICTGEINNE